MKHQNRFCRTFKSTNVFCRMLAVTLVMASCGSNRTDSAGENKANNSLQSPTDPEVLNLSQNQCSSTEIEKITVSPRGQLYINAPEVLNNPRALNTDPANRGLAGPWSFAFAMREILELPDPGTDPARLATEERAVDQFISTFGQISANGVTASARPAVNILRSSWGTRNDSGPGRTPRRWLGGAPYKLVAIVNRMDIVKRNEDGTVRNTTAGEGRLVFTFTGGGQQTVIFEYDLPVGTASPSGNRTQADWTNDWKSLKPFLADTNRNRAGIQPNQDVNTQPAFTNSAQYLSTLQGITDKFVIRSAQTRTSGTTRSTQAAISQIRTNDFIQSGSRFVPWELREIIRARESGTNRAALQPTTTKNAFSSINSRQASSADKQDQDLGIWVDRNMTCPSPNDISSCRFSAPQNSLPTFIQASPNTRVTKEWRQGPASPVDGQWFASDSGNIKRRFYALQSCDGCHSTETGVGFVHTGVFDGAPSTFLTASTRIGNFTQEADLSRRMRNFRNLVCLAAVNSNFDLASKPDVVIPIRQRLGVSESVH